MQESSAVAFMVSIQMVLDTMHTSFAAPAAPKQKNIKAPTVRLKRKVKLSDKWTFATIARKGDRYVWDSVLVDGSLGRLRAAHSSWSGLRPDERFSGRYLRSIQSKPRNAKTAQESLLKLQSQGHAADVEVISRGIPLRDHFNKYLDERRHALGWDRCSSTRRTSTGLLN